jgi:signal transduction histidine kinase
VIASESAGWAAALALGAIAAWQQARGDRERRRVARAGHELRGPLCAARLGLHGLQAGEDVPQRAAAIELELSRAGRALDDLARARGRARRRRRQGQGQRRERHEERDRKELVDVGALAAEAAPTWRALAVARGASLDLRAPSGAAIVVADPIRLLGALGNLVANAVEHGGGRVRVTVAAAAGRVRVEVADEGPGLAAPVERLVGAAERSRGERGHGLGIAARVARDAGGRLAAAPSARGARLVIDLPAAEPAAAGLAS